MVYLAGCFHQKRTQWHGVTCRWLTSRQSTWPVLKHGPRSLTCARVIGSYETQRRSESKDSPSRWVVVRHWFCDQVPQPHWQVSCITGPSYLSSCKGVEQERTCWDPKDGELCLCRLKPEEILVEDRSDSDVQIDHQTWV